MKSIRIALVICVMAATIGLMGSALAQGSAEQPEVKGKVLHRGKSQAPGVLGSLTPRQRGATGALPFTGSDVTLFLVVGVAAVGAGTLIVRRTRTTRGL